MIFRNTRQRGFGAGNGPAWRCVLRALAGDDGSDAWMDAGDAAGVLEISGDREEKTCLRISTTMQSIRNS